MTKLNVQSRVPVVGNRLTSRLSELGVVVAVVRRDGQVSIQGEASEVAGWVAGAANFQSTVKSRFDEILETKGEPVAIWPGVWLVQLPPAKRRRVSRQERFEDDVLLAGLLIGQEFVGSDQFKRTCDLNEFDIQAAEAKARSASLIAQGEAVRVGRLIAWMQDDAAELETQQNELKTMSSQLCESYEELSLLYKFTTGMAFDRPPDSLITDVVQELRQVVGLRWLALQLCDDDERMEETRGRIYLAGDLKCEESVLLRIGRKLIDEREPHDPAMIVDDTNTLGIPVLPRLSENLLVVPLSDDDRMIGILFGGDKLDDSHISSIDSKLCSSLASSVAMYLENRMLYEDSQTMFLGTLHALTASIDAKDSYTRGHSERVAMLSRDLARAAGLDPAIVERVYLAGLVHDVGKIGVPEAVLCKPGRLTAEEFELIKQHPAIGSRILSDIRQMRDLIPGVLYHHERWDGRGYPEEIRGEDIPLFGRLIGLADAFDAMSSNRTYRSSLDHQKVLDEIERCAGAQFDPELAKYFVKMDFTRFFAMIRTHKAQTPVREVKQDNGYGYDPEEGYAV